jgi:SAM-dependent methyltransferase
LIAINPSTVLDVGCGYGNYSKFVKDLLPNVVIDAVEPTTKYVDEYDLVSKYNTVYNVSIQEYTRKDHRIYDAIICFDILEHLYLSEAIDTLECLRYYCKNLLIAWPTNAFQACWGGNHYEKHKCNIYLSDLTRFNITSYMKTPIDANNNIEYHYAHIIGLHGKHINWN